MGCVGTKRAEIDSTPVAKHLQKFAATFLYDEPQRRTVNHSQNDRVKSLQLFCHANSTLGALGIQNLLFLLSKKQKAYRRRKIPRVANELNRKFFMLY